MKQNYFELFQLPISFDLNVNDLAARHRAVIARVHPDQFANKSAVEQRMALQWATFANEAFDALKSPVSRAHYLLQLHAPELAEHEARVALPPAFLMQQMMWREALEDGQSDSVRSEVQAEHELALQQLSAQCAAQNWNDVAQTLAKYQFIENFLAQLPSSTQ